MNLPLAILQTLAPLPVKLMMPRTALLGDLRLAGRSETLAEIDAELRRLEESREIIGISNADTGTKYKIADSGRARLAEAGLL